MVFLPFFWVCAFLLFTINNFRQIAFGFQLFFFSTGIRKIPNGTSLLRISCFSIIGWFRNCGEARRSTTDTDFAFTIFAFFVRFLGRRRVSPIRFERSWRQPNVIHHRNVVIVMWSACSWVRRTFSFCHSNEVGSISNEDSENCQWKVDKSNLIRPCNTIRIIKNIRNAIKTMNQFIPQSLRLKVIRCSLRMNEVDYLTHLGCDNCLWKVDGVT